MSLADLSEFFSRKEESKPTKKNSTLPTKRKKPIPKTDGEMFSKLSDLPCIAELKNKIDKVEIVKPIIEFTDKETEDNFNKICSLIEQKKNIFITGGGGVGKSYILKKLQDIYDITLTSTTGISALNIKGQTLHSWAGIGICNKSISSVISKIKKNKKKLKLIQQTKILAIDEISMLDDYTLDYLNTVLKEVIGSYRPFGGIQVILIGDFFQLPPVKLGTIIEKKPVDFCFNSNTWKELSLNTIYLRKVYRQTDKKLIETLNNIREGNIQDTSIFRECNKDLTDEHIRLYATNNEVDNYNMYMFNRINNKEYIFNAQDEILSFVKGKSIWLDPESNSVPEMDKLLFQSFNQNCKAPKQLRLKESCRVMLLQNIDVKKGLVNGSCGTVLSINQSTIKVKFDNGVIFFVEKSDFELELNGHPKINRKQFPLMLAWSVSIHKSQGCTFDKVFIDFKRIFTFGQAYVALSRAKTLQGLYIQNFDPFKIKANPTVINFYKNIFIK